MPVLHRLAEVHEHGGLGGRIGMPAIGLLLTLNQIGRAGELLHDENVLVNLLEPAERGCAEVVVSGTTRHTPRT